MKPLNEQIDPKYTIQARKLAKYTQLLNQILPIECRGHVEVANIRQQNLMLITDSPVWTTKLRQLSPQILAFIHKNSNTSDNQSHVIHHVQISTRYHANQPKAHPSSTKSNRQRPHISENVAELLSQSANSIDSPTLKAALLRVARHGHSDEPITTKTKK